MFVYIKHSDEKKKKGMENPFMFPKELRITTLLGLSKSSKGAKGSQKL